MQIVELRFENFARLRAGTVRPAPGENVVVISGRNDQGKTSVLNAAKAVMQGKSGAPMRALRDGTEQGFIEADCGRLKVTRTIKRNGNGEAWDLRVTLDGKRVAAKPQDVINGFLGAISFDPLAFARANSGVQVQLLQTLVAGFNFEAYRTERARLYADRTSVGRDRDREQAAADAVELPPGPRPAPVDAGERVRAALAASEHNAQIMQRLARRKQLLAEIEAMLDEAEELRARAMTLEGKAAAEHERLAKAEPLPDPIDVAAIQVQAQEAEAINKVVALFDSREKHERTAAGHADMYRSYTDMIEALDAKRDAKVAEAKLPAGLGIAEDEAGRSYVTVNGVPIEQAGTALGRIMASAAVGMALNPGLRVLLIDEGSELDSHALAALGEMARKADFQIWLTRVDESGQVGFVVEDGSVS